MSGAAPLHGSGAALCIANQTENQYDEVHMTAIAALVENDKVWIGGDSAGVGGYSLAVRKDEKVFKNGEFLMGYTSSFRMGQLLRYSLTPPKPIEGQEAFEYMVTKFVESVRSCLKRGGYSKESNNQETGGTFLVGWRGRLYMIYSDYQVAELAEPYCACGCGEDLVLGSLYTTRDMGMSPKDRIKRALSAAESFSAGVRGPFKIMSSK